MITEGTGTDVPGTGNPGNPYVINVDGSEISGQGVGWQASQFVVRILPGGGLEFDSSGALRTSAAPPPPGQGRANVVALEQRTQDVIGGSLGAGFLVKPPDLLSSFTYGVQQGLDFLHVPVRFLMDGSPVVRISETMERTNRNPAEHVQDQDWHVWQITTAKPGQDYFHRLGEDFAMPSQGPPNAPRTGWYGYLAHGQLGLTHLADVFREVGGRAVLLLDLRFPARGGDGFAHTTPPRRTDNFLTQVRNMILAHGLTDSVIVTSTEVEIPSASNPPTRNVLDFFQQSAIRVGPYLESQAAADAHPPDATWPATWTWVFLSRSISRATLQGYVNRAAGLPPLHTILFVVTRQHLRTDLVNLPAGIGAKGVISADPIYYRGDDSRYWLDVLRNSTVKHGLLPAQDESLSRMSWAERGAGRSGQSLFDGMWMGREIPKDPASTTAFVLEGYLCPHPFALNGGWDIGVGFDQLPPAGGYGWAAVAFGITRDHGFRDRPAGSPPDPTNYPFDSGYVVLVDSNGGFFLFGYDRGARTDLNNTGTTPVPYGAPKPIGHPQNSDRRRGVPMYFRVGWNDSGIKISQITRIGDPTTGPMIIQSTAQLAKDYRGGYLYFGRYSQTDVAWDCFFDNVTVINNGAPPIGP